VHLVQREPVTGHGPALRWLGREHGQRMFLDLVLAGVEPPAAGVSLADGMPIWPRPSLVMGATDALRR
jgi:hypothetical protein